MNSSAKCKLKIDWVDVAAARYALEHWYYRAEYPTGKTAKLGVWEDDRFIGVLIFGVSGNNGQAKSVGLSDLECVELLRVAMTTHRSQMSKIMGICLRMIAKHYPGLKAIVTYCDPSAGHHGGIYQAGNWIYLGTTKPIDVYKDAQGTIHHWRNARRMQKEGIPLEKMYLPGKHKYIYPITKEMRAVYQSQGKPFPPAAEVSDQPRQGQSDGLTPIRPLQS